MRKNHISLICLCILATPVALAEGTLFRVVGYGAHNNGNLTYHYRIINNTTHGTAEPVSVGRIEIGRASFDHKPEFTVLPIYDDPRHGEGEHVSSPMGWKGYVSGDEGEPGNTIVWEVNTDSSPYPTLPPGQTLTGLNVTLPEADPKYLNGHFFVSVQPSGGHWSTPSGIAERSGLIEREDSTPPVLSVSAAPSILWPPNTKLVPVTVSILVKDDYDPQPEIKLESITANETLAAGDIVDARMGTDDRSFSLMASRNGSNKAGRIYTITYSATDGTGNKSTASTTVTVPHDQGK